ncbi:MAG TPA: NAD(P)/FAD-dependent oxidoreductase [Candidatus Limnocylindria bacterium]|nr:NAD(P)/FAD-dependent oxidoreductase [Candidatus Limnocylindria bacterium]
MLVSTAVCGQRQLVDADVIVIGGGAAGLFCARTAGLRGRKVVLLEHNQRIGNKILISGGGRCNFTNTGATAANYVTSGSPHFAKSALARYKPADFLALVERHGIAWHEKKLGQLFCDHSSKEIVELLEKECADARVDIRINSKVSRVEPAMTNGTRHYRVHLTGGTLEAQSLVIACGGLSFPKLGASPFGYQIAAQFGVKLVSPRPGLVPLVLGPKSTIPFAEISGVSIECIASAGPDAPKFRENLLFTHRGLSGPAILQISSYCEPGGKIRLDLLPGVRALDFFAANRAGGREVRNALRQVLPERFVDLLHRRRSLAKAIAQLPQRELEDIARELHEWEVQPVDTEGYPKAEVTVGGVDTAELSSKTLEARRVPGLFFIGEVVDVTGWLGGYNFQWAWASGHAAGQAV